MKKHLKNIVRKFDTEDKSKYDYVLNQSERIKELEFFDWNRFKQSIEQEDFFHYPNTQEFKESISKFYDVGSEEILLCAGSDVGIKSVFETFTNGGRVVTTDPSFPMYKVYSELYQCEYFGIPHEKDYTISVEKILSNITNDTDLIILANPNSPMGEYKSFDDIIPILEQDVPVLIDEAYIEFRGMHSEFDDVESFTKYINEYPNLIITRTFSKAFGGAGSRVGMVFSNKDNIELISKFRHMYEISAVSMKYCKFLLENPTIVEEYIKSVERERQYIIYALSKSYEVLDTNCNWIHFNTEDDNTHADNVFYKHKVLVKWCKLPHDNRENWCRFTISPGISEEPFFKELLDVH